MGGRLVAFAGLVGLLGLLPGCPHVDADSGVFACTTDADCGNGWQCIDHACVNPHSPLAGTQCTPACLPGGDACCGGKCADLAKDPKNCGSCGHACAAEEACAAGRCGRETRPGACANGLDDDGDGLVDCADTADCPKDSACSGGRRCCEGECRSEATDELCSNGLDDDCNGQADCQDAGCIGRRCAPGKVCGDHGCVAGCEIGRTFVAPDAAHPASACRRCQPDRDPHAWSLVPALAQVDGCRGNDACDGTGLCRRALGQPCAGNGDCASKTCREGRCAR